MEVPAHKENGIWRSKEGDGPEIQMFGETKRVDAAESVW